LINAKSYKNRRIAYRDFLWKSSCYITTKLAKHPEKLDTVHRK
jgi:hypothetical protein